MSKLLYSADEARKITEPKTELNEVYNHLNKKISLATQNGDFFINLNLSILNGLSDSAIEIFWKEIKKKGYLVTSTNFNDIKQISWY